MTKFTSINRRSFVRRSLVGGMSLLASGGVAGAAAPSERPEAARTGEDELEGRARTEVDFIDRRWVEHTYFLTRKVSEGEKFSREPVIADSSRYPIRKVDRTANLAADQREDEEAGHQGEDEGGPQARVTADPGWGADPAQARGAVHPTTEGLAMWYGSPQAMINPAGRIIGFEQVVRYAVSEDGRRFVRPNLGRYEFRGSRDNNIVIGLNEKDGKGHWLSGPRGCAGFCVLDAARQPVPHARGRYTALYGSRLPSGHGLCLAWSDDGLRWNAYPENPVTPSSDTYCNFFYDPRQKRYFLYIRPSNAPDGIRAGPHGVRTLMSRIESADLIHWGNERVVFDTDEADAPAQGTVRAGRAHDPNNIVRGRDIVCYGMTVSPHQGGFIGIPQLYDTVSGKKWCELVHSYDGADWRREPRRQPFIPVGPDGAWDSGMIGYVSAGGPAVMGDDWYFYYSGTNWTHHHEMTAFPERGRLYQIGSVRVKRGRLVGYWTGGREGSSGVAEGRRVPAAWANRGELLTRPFRFQAASIELNADASRGQVIAEICEANGKTIAGFGRDHAVALRQDRCRQALVYRGGASVANLQGRVIRLRLHLESAAVFGLSFP